MIDSRTSLLSARYNGQIPSDVRESMHEVVSLLSSRADEVNSVTFLETFSKDLEQSILQNTSVYKGLVVSVKPDFVFQAEDIAWVHPNFCQTRSLFPGGEFASLRNKTLHLGSSAGVYATMSEDDVGIMQKTFYTVVDYHIPHASERVVSEWLKGSTAKEAYEQYLTSPLKGFSNIQECASSQALDLAVDLNVVEGAIATYHTNVFHKDKGAILFSNHAFNDTGLVNISPLHGFMAVSRAGYIPSDLSSADEFVNVSDLDDKQVARIFNSCHWGSSIVNSVALRKPIEGWQGLFSGQRYKLTEAHFASSDAVTPKLAPRYLHVMSATADQLAEGVGMDYHHENKIKIESSHEVVTRLLDMKADILNPEYYSSGHLYLPRDWVNDLAR